MQCVPLRVGLCWLRLLRSVLTSAKWESWKGDGLDYTHAACTEQIGNKQNVRYLTRFVPIYYMTNFVGTYVVKIGRNEKLWVSRF